MNRGANCSPLVMQLKIRFCPTLIPLANPGLYLLERRMYYASGRLNCLLTHLIFEVLRIRYIACIAEKTIGALMVSTNSTV